MSHGFALLSAHPVGGRWAHTETKRPKLSYTYLSRSGKPMNIAEATRIALQSLWANKLRSVLTLLGVVIGVSSVIAVVTFVNGINSYVAEKVFNLGADVFIVSKMPNVITNIDQLLEGQRRKDIELDDYRAVLEGCAHCAAVGASVNTPEGHVRYAEQSSSDTGIRGWTPSMATIYDLDVTE